jgi:hypothetical protein
MEINLKIKNNFKSEVMKSNNQKQKIHNIQHAYITTFCTLPFQKPAVLTCCYMTDIWHLELHITFNLRHLHLADLQFPFLHWQCTKPCPPLNDILLTISLTLISLTGTSDTSKVAFAKNWTWFLLLYYPFICPTLVPIL